MRIFRKAPALSLVFDPFTSDFFWTHPTFSTAAYTIWGMFLGLFIATVVGVSALALLVHML